MLSRKNKNILSDKKQGIDYVKDKSVYPKESDISEFIEDLILYKSVPKLWSIYWDTKTGKLSIAKFNTVKGVMLTKPTPLNSDPNDVNELQYHINQNYNGKYSFDEFSTIIRNLIYHGENTRLILVSKANQGKTSTEKLIAQIVNNVVFTEEITWSILGQCYESLLSDAKYELLCYLIKNTQLSDILGIKLAIQTVNLDFLAFATKNNTEIDFYKKLLIFLDIFAKKEKENVGYEDTAFYISILNRFKNVLSEEELSGVFETLSKKTFFITDETVELFRKNYTLMEITDIIADASKTWMKRKNIKKLTLINIYL